MLKTIIILLLSVFAPVKSMAQVSYPVITNVTSKADTIEALQRRERRKERVEKFWEPNHSWDIGIIGGVAGVQDDLAIGKRGLFGVNMTAAGIYLDALINLGKSSYDYETGDESGVTVFSFHGGYQIPISRYIRIIPVIGYGKVSEGTSSGTEWYVDYDYDVHHKYYENYGEKWFDYGATAVINIKHFNIYLTYTKHFIYGGIGVSFYGD